MQKSDRVERVSPATNLDAAVYVSFVVLDTQQNANSPGITVRCSARDAIYTNTNERSYTLGKLSA